ncbi:MAG: GAF domain-containing protein [Xenococcus sp. MO_188.B8]|nr:GAF domain-containing protein [Xenococcus sp. MO_188.B8]
MNANLDSILSELNSILSELIPGTLGLNDVCDKIENELNFDFAAIQLIRQEQKIIESVFGAEWVGLSRHYLERDEDLRDIQADIAQTCRTEIIAGDDKRFDRGVYRQFSHESMVRIFTPILLIKDEKGELIPDWFDKCKFVSRETHKEHGYHKIIEVDLSGLNREENKTLIEVVGTVEVGRKYPSKKIEISEAQDLIKLVGKQFASKKLKIYQYVFSSAVEKLASIIKKLVNADTSSLFFNIKPIQDLYIHEIKKGKINQRPLEVKENHIPYTYQFSSGSIAWSDFSNYPLLLGEDTHVKEVIENKKWKYVKALDEADQTVHVSEIKEMLVFPLIHEEGNDKDFQYLLILYFKNENSFEDKLLDKVNQFLGRGLNLIQEIITFQNSKEQYSQLLALKTGVDSIVRNLDKKELLHYIAWNTLNILATDIVMIYEYIDTDNDQEVFPCERVIAGKLKNKEQVSNELDELIKSNLLDEHIQNTPDNPVSIDKKYIKLEDEYIKSTYVILLRSKYRKKDVEGVMVINYRRPYEFSDNEKQFIEELANVAAIAIYDQRLLEEKERLRAREKFANYADEFDHAFKRAYDGKKLETLEQRKEFANDFAQKLENN